MSLLFQFLLGDHHHDYEIFIPVFKTPFFFNTSVYHVCFAPDYFIPLKQNGSIMILIIINPLEHIFQTFIFMLKETNYFPKFQYVTVAKNLTEDDFLVLNFIQFL